MRHSSTLEVHHIFRLIREIVWLILLLFCLSSPAFAQISNDPLPGACQPENYIPILRQKKIALVVNQTSRTAKEHLVDFLISQHINIRRIFAPEHGFRGDSGAGEKVSDHTDMTTGLPLISLYGKNRKPTPEQLSDVDLIVFDIQDVGCRFYTYISTLHLVMEACAEQKKPLLILDRPNPNGDQVDGPVLQPAFRSFVGIDPIPVLHGCTLGELALMINGEHWLGHGLQTALQVISVTHYTHATPYKPPVRPSPNLPNYQSIRLYPSLCFFEATRVSIGRGTPYPFQVIGYPDSTMGPFRFKPIALPGMDLHPIQQGETCFGEDLRSLDPPPTFTLRFFMEWLHRFKISEQMIDRKEWFNKLMGNDTVLQLILAGQSETQIRHSWVKELDRYKSIRHKYLLYPENSPKP